MHHFCTYFDVNYLTRGLALYGSLQRHCREPFALWVLCFGQDVFHALSKMDLADIRLIHQESLEKEDGSLLKAKVNRSQVEYYWTCTPSLPLYILREDRQVNFITYLDADLFFFADPLLLLDSTSGASIVLTEHGYAESHRSWEGTSGKYNVSMLGFRRDAHALSCLEWWRDRCLEWCYDRHEDGKYGDQGYLDDWPSRFRNVVVLRQKGAGLAPWNLEGRCISGPGGSPVLDAEPVVFYHFHGLKKMSRLVYEPMHAHYTRFAGPRAMRLLYVPYIEALRAAEKRVARDKDGRLPGIPAAGSARRIRAGLLDNTYFLAGPPWLGLVLWRYGAWQRVEKRAACKLRDAAVADMRAGRFASARGKMIRALGRYPTMVFSRHLLSVLVALLLGKRLHKLLHACLGKEEA